MTKELNLGIIVEAKAEYTKQLINIMKPYIYNELLSCFNESLNVSETQIDVLMQFQRNLKQIPKWNSDVIEEHTNEIIEDCSFFNELITAVFISNVRILTSVKLSKNKKKVKIVIPPVTKFVAKVYTNCAKNVYNDPYLFSINRYKDISNNMIDVYNVIGLSIEDTIRDMLPIQNILETYLDDTLEEKEDEHSEDENLVPPEEDDGIPEEEPTDDNTLDPDEETPIEQNNENETLTEDFFSDKTKNINIEGKVPNQSTEEPSEQHPIEEPKDISSEQQPPQGPSIRPGQSFFNDAED
mgnify:CR=1 FL=1